MRRSLLLLLIGILGLSVSLSGQTDTLKTDMPTDTMAPAPQSAAPQDTLPIAQDTVPVQQDTVAAKSKKDRKPYDKFKIGAGLSVGRIDAKTRYESEDRLGYLISFAYQRGRFFYWEAGVEWNSTRIEFLDETNEEEDEFSIGAVDVPVSVGINLLSVVDRVVGLRAFVGATPSLVVNVGENNLGIGKSDTNTFNAYLHAGVGVNVIFLYVDAIYKYGITDLFEGYSSQPQQFQVKLGFRF